MLDFGRDVRQVSRRVMSRKPVDVIDNWTAIKDILQKELLSHHLVVTNQNARFYRICHDKISLRYCA